MGKTFRFSETQQELIAKSIVLAIQNPKHQPSFLAKRFLDQWDNSHPLQRYYATETCQNIWKRVLAAYHEKCNIAYRVCNGICPGKIESYTQNFDDALRFASNREEGDKIVVMRGEDIDMFPLWKIYERVGIGSPCEHELLICSDTRYCQLLEISNDYCPDEFIIADWKEIIPSALEDFFNADIDKSFLCPFCQQATAHKLIPKFSSGIYAHCPICGSYHVMQNFFLPDTIFNMEKKANMRHSIALRLQNRPDKSKSVCILSNGELLG